MENYIQLVNTVQGLYERGIDIDKITNYVKSNQRIGVREAKTTVTDIIYLYKMKQKE